MIHVEPTLVIVEAITLETIRADLLEQEAAGGPAMVFYAVHTCWWTHDPEHLALLAGGHVIRDRVLAQHWERATGGHALPCDPRGSVLLQTRPGHGVEFLRNAEANPAHYGRHGLRAFLASHRLNSRTATGQPWSEAGWDAYNAALDRRDAQLRAQRGRRA